MTRTQVVVWVMGLWLASFAFCVGAAFFGTPQIPPRGPGGTQVQAPPAGKSEAPARSAEQQARLDLATAAAETFGAQLALMLAFIFGTDVVAKMRSQDALRKGQVASTALDDIARWIAVFVAAIYCAVFVVMFYKCGWTQWTAADTIENVTAARPLLLPLVTGMIALYFAREI